MPLDLTIPGPWRNVSELADRSAVPAWVTGMDKDRVAAYDAYEAIYWTDPKSFKLTMRGQEGNPIYVPSGRKVVNTAHRYLANDPTFYVDPAFGSDSERAEALQLLNDFLDRERVLSKFSSNKRNGLMKGDWLWHLIADPEREAEARISIETLDPALYFPEYNDLGEKIAVHLLEGTMWNERPAVKKLTYHKETERGGPSTILVRDVICLADEWGQPQTDMPERVVRVIDDWYELDAPIDSIPVYHIQNQYDPDFPYGSSEMRGIERLMAAINQAITDEEVTLVLEGLGVYVTDAGQPVNEQGQPVPWNLGPARVIEIPTEKTFERVNSAGTVAPYLDHLKYLHDQIDDSTDTNDVTRGSVDVAIAESGIALAIKMGPMLAHTGESELTVTSVTHNMLFDLRKWFAAYEDFRQLENIRWKVKYGDKMPPNKQQDFNNILSLAAPSGTGPPVISAAEARRQLIKQGWEFDAAMEGEIQQEQQAAADALTGRIGADIGALGGP